ncbi:HET-domain-containing protein [Xylaria scruposa]|nr:HET-domain-containing protein [Xylaria scruposa]
MWLIDTDTLELKLHPSQPSSEYVILSHTWEEEEVTFQDFQNLDVARTKKGFSKIEKTCRLARKSKMKWAWVDTCCIDKTSSAELSEAINSMYRYYQNATVCYAYLSDLPAEDDAEVPLAQCRWFTRGWTLQELLAPSNIEFYDHQWNLRGTKKSLKHPLSAITKIDVRVLMNTQLLEDYPVAVRMSWAAKRETTRPEDIAYCLLGIFGVYMPMLYGEGKNAFLRLQDEICKGTDDLSIFAWKRHEITPFCSGLFARSPAEYSSCRGALFFHPRRNPKY